MALSDYIPESRDVVLGGSTLRLEGLSLEHVAIIIREHLPDLEAVMEMFNKAQKATPGDIMAIATALVSQAPGLSANLIALSCNEPDSADKAMKISFPKQVEIIMTIGDLTFSEVGGVKKGVGAITSLLMTMKSAKALTKPKKAE